MFRLMIYFQQLYISINLIFLIIYLEQAHYLLSLKNKERLMEVKTLEFLWNIKMTESYDSFAEHLPSKGWLADYSIYASETEIPPRFNFFTGVICLSSVLRRHVWYETAYKTFPNFYIILVSPSGVGKKSTAIGFGLGLLKKMEKEPNILPRRITPEDMIYALKEQGKQGEFISNQVHHSSSGLLVTKEVKNLLGKQQYMAGMIPLLTELYDCEDDWDSGTLKRGREYLKNVFLSWIGGSTPEWLIDSIGSGEEQGGFMSRLLCILCPPHWNPRIRKPPKRDKELQAKLVKDLEEISQLFGEATYSEEANGYHDDWYEKRERDVAIAGFHERESDVLTKLAIILQVSKNKSLSIERSTLEEALNILKFLEKDAKEILALIGAEEIGRKSAWILNKLKELEKENPGQWVRKSFLQQRVWYRLKSSTHLDECISFLAEGDKIEIMHFKPGGWHIKSRGGYIK